jgi:DNA-binding LacI/PurR family transcriptional regulator
VLYSYGTGYVTGSMFYDRFISIAMISDRRPTISDVARQAGVSKATVSRVVNNVDFVEDETKQRVQQAVLELGYRPNNAARSLTTKRTRTIGMIISDSSNLFFGDMLRGAEDILQPLNYGLLICNTDEVLERESHYFDLLLRHQVEGIIAAATSRLWDVLGKAELQHTPVVYVDRVFEGLERPYIGVNNVGGAYLGTRHLITSGYQDIGVIAGFQRLSTMRERLAGFRQALQEHNIAVPDEWVVTCPLSIEAGRVATRQLLTLPARPKALFVNNNLLSLGALLAIKDLGLRCPDDIALVGFDDHPWAAVAAPPLTVVRQPARELGRVAAQALCMLINGESLPDQQVMLECELVVRESC